MKSVKCMFCFVTILFVGCKNTPNTFVYKDKVEITFPFKYYSNGSVIFDNDYNKIGEFSPGLITPLKSISFLEFLELYKNGGIIEAKETKYSYDYEEDAIPNIIRIDTVQLTNYKWYFIVDKIVVSTGDSNECRNLYKFLTFEKDKILIINFFEKDIENDKSDYYIDIVKTVKIR